MVLPNSVKIFASEICSNIKNTGIVISSSKNLIFGRPLSGVSERKWHPQTMSNFLSFKYLLI